MGLQLRSTASHGISTCREREKAKFGVCECLCVHVWEEGVGGGHLVSGDNDTVTSPFAEISWHYSSSLASLIVKVLGRGE